MLLNTAPINARARSKHIKQKQNGKRQEIAKAIELKGLTLIDDNRIENNGVSCIIVYDFDTQVLNCA